MKMNSKVGFLITAICLFLVKSFYAGMGLPQMAILSAVCASLGLTLWKFRKPLVRALNASKDALFNGPSLLHISVFAFAIMQAVFMLDIPTFFEYSFIFSVALFHGLAPHCEHQDFCSTAKPVMLIALAFQFASFLFQGSLAAMAAVLVMNHSALIILPKHFPHENLNENKTYSILAHATLSTLLLHNSYSLFHISTEISQIIKSDTLGWGALFSTNYFVTAVMCVLLLLVLLISFGINQIKDRTSAVFVLAVMVYTLFTPWGIVPMLLYLLCTTYILMEKQYYTLDDLIHMAPNIPEALENQVLAEFLDNAKYQKDLTILEDYICENPSFGGWHTYLHACMKIGDVEKFNCGLNIAQLSLEKSSYEILFPEDVFEVPN